MAAQIWKLIIRQVIRESRPWVIPFALFFSAGCWLAPIRYIIRPQPHEYSIATVIGQYIGLFSALLLGEWHRRAFPQHGRWMWAACGLLGMGWATFIFDLMAGGDHRIYLYCAILQILWLLRVAFHRASKLERDLLVERKDMLSASGTLLGSGFMHAERFAVAASGLLFCISCAIIGWTAVLFLTAIRQLSPDTAESSVHIIMVMASSAGISLMLAILGGTVTLTLSMARDSLLVIPAPTDRRWLGVLFLPYLAGVLLMTFMIMGGLAVRSGGFLAAIVGLFSVWTLGYIAILIHLKRVSARLSSHDLNEASDEISRRAVEAARDHILERMPQTVTATEQGVQVGNIGGHRVIPWTQVRFLFPMQAMRLLIIDSDGNETMCLRTAGSRGTPNVMEQLLSAWGRQVPVLSDRILCEYGSMWQERDRKAAEAEHIAVLVLGLLLIIVGIFLPFLSEKELNPLLWLLLAGSIVAVGLALAAGAFRMSKRPSRILTSAIVEPGRATFTWTNGPDTVLQKGDIRKCRYNGPESSFSMRLCNGHVINHLERLSNFGLVYRCLLELIPGSTQTKSNDQST